MATDWLLTANINTFVKRHRSLFVLYLVALVGSSQACPCRIALLKPRDTSASPGEVEKILKSVGPSQTRQNPNLQQKPGTGIVSKALFPADSGTQACKTTALEIPKILYRLVAPFIGNLKE